MSRPAIARPVAAWCLLAALAAPWCGCASEASSPRLDPIPPVMVSGTVRAPGDSADLATWTARRDLALARLGAGVPVVDRVEAARCTRNRALALAGAGERAGELARADALAREALRSAPGDRSAGYWVARIALDRFREGGVGGEALVEARRLLAVLVADDRSFGAGAALAALAEAYASAGGRRPEAPELERAAAFFESTLDVDPGQRAALLEYAEEVLVPWGDLTSARRRLGACAELPLVEPSGDGQRFVDDDRAQRRCAEILARTPEARHGAPAH